MDLFGCKDCGGDRFLHELFDGLCEGCLRRPPITTYLDTILKKGVPRKKGETLRTTCRNVFDGTYYHKKYKIVVQGIHCTIIKE